MGKSGGSLFHVRPPSSSAKLNIRWKKGRFGSCEKWKRVITLVTEHVREKETESKRTIQPRLGGSVGWSIIPYTKRLQVRAPVRVHRGGNQLIFLSHIDVYLPLFPTKINKHILRRGFGGEDNSQYSISKLRKDH